MTRPPPGHLPDAHQPVGRRRPPWAPGIALLTPYGGTNLGDGAIQTAVIDGIRRHIPDARLHGLTLNPRETSRRHGIPGFPLTGLLVDFYSESLFDALGAVGVAFRDGGAPPTIPGPATETEPLSRLRLLWERIKPIPGVGTVLKWLLQGVRGGAVLLHEIRHLGTSLRFVNGIDMVIAAGGGQLDEEWGGPWGHPYVLCRWAILARIARKKFAVVSVGVGQLRSTLGRLFVRIALRLACYRSFRDEGSRELVSRWTFTSTDPCIPDLAFSLNRSPTDEALAAAPVRVVGVSPIAYGHEANWPTPDPDVYQRYLANLAEFVRRLVSSDYRVVLLASSGADRRVMQDLRAHPALDTPKGTRDRVQVSEAATVGEFLDAVRATGVMVVSRLHGAILSHMSGKPVVAVSFDRKVNAHMADMGQSAYVVNIATVTADDLWDRFTAITHDAARVRDTLREQLEALRGPLERQYEHLAALLRSDA